MSVDFPVAVSPRRMSLKLYVRPSPYRARMSASMRAMARFRNSSSAKSDDVVPVAFAVVAEASAEVNALGT